jgi:hypothetical protein
MALFTAETARLNALKSVEKRRAARVEREANVNGETAHGSFEATANPASTEFAAGGFARDYQTAQVARVRGHLATLDALLDKALAKGDAQAIERLARARATFEEAERRMSNRSLPPVVRSGKRVPGRASSLLEE